MALPIHPALEMLTRQEAADTLRISLRVFVRHVQPDIAIIHAALCCAGEIMPVATFLAACRDAFEAAQARLSHA